nr:hypothetical protein [Tanacetum cinerariifolium]GEY97985.1 hypothetical protein [Tanacetum cinerariifolium]
MGEPLLPDCVFDFLVDEPEPHPAYDFFAPGPLLGYAGNPNNKNGWIEADMPLLGELGVVADEPMAEEEVIASVVDMDEDIAVLFGDDDFKDDDSRGFNEEDEVWEVNEEWLMAPVTPPLMLAVQPPSVYKVGGPSTISTEGQSYPLPALGLPVPPSVIKDLSTRLGVGDGVLDGSCRGQIREDWHSAVQQRDTQIQQLRATVSEMSSRESTLM